MAYYCLDYINGSDTTGDGTALAPWATIAHAETQINGGTGYVTGDEIRIAGSTKSASLGTVQYSNSTSSEFVVNTDQDLTASVSVGDYLLIGDETDGGAMPAPLLVKSITSTVIRFYTAYYDALYSNVSYNVYKLSNVAEMTVNSFSDYSGSLVFNSLNTSFTAYNNDVIFSGGWDPANFTAKTNYGKTAFGRTGTYGSTNAYAYGAVFYPASSTTSSDGFLFKDFSVARTYIFRYVSTSTASGYNLDGFDFVYSGESTYSMSSGTRSLNNIGVGSGNFVIGSGGISSNTSSFTTIDNWRVVIGGQTSSFGPYFRVYQNYNDRVTTTTNLQIDFLTRRAGNLFYNSDFPNDLSEVTILSDSGAQFGVYNTIASIGESSPTISIPDSIANEVAMISYNSNINAANFVFSSIAVVPKLGISTSGTVTGPWRDFTLLDSATGVKYNLGGNEGGLILNTTDNATGTNCIQFTAFKNGKINGNVGLGFIADPGDTLTIDISAKILGTTSNVTPQFYVAIDGASGYYTRFSNALSKTNMTKTAGTSFNNTTYDTLTYSVTLPQYSSYTSTAKYVIGLDASLPTGESLLIDSVTQTIS